MTSHAALPPQAVARIAEAVFAKGEPVVVEGKSAFDTALRRFHSPAELCAYVDGRRGHVQGMAIVAVHYADAGGRLECERIDFDPSVCDGFSHCFEPRGWGLVWVHFNLRDGDTLGSWISANSRKRAETWSRTYPEMDPPDTWDWPVVASHARRLARATKMAATAWE